MNRRDSLTVLLAGFCPRVSPGASAPKTETMEAAARIIQRQVESGALESAVLEVRRGAESFRRAFGKAASADAMFLLGSITKPMTATAVMVLADRGELSLTDRVVRFIPEFSEGARAEITIQQLLTHTSGLPDQLPENDTLRRRHAPLAEFVQGVVRTPLLFAPGTKYHYQSMGILLAADIAESVTKTPLPKFLADEVFKPLGMTRSALGLGSFKPGDVVRCQTEHAAPEAGGGDPEAKGWDWNSDYWRNLAAPWGGAHCSAADVGLFLDSFMQANGKVLREATARQMIQNHTECLGARRGIGFALGPEGFGRGCSARSFGHSGSTGTLAWADPATDTTCVILTSLPSRVSGDSVLHPVSDLVSSSWTPK
jgi:CubicO group peptidase (beta-lactamase class C family)